MGDIVDDCCWFDTIPARRTSVLRSKSIAMTVVLFLRSRLDLEDDLLGCLDVDVIEFGLCPDRN
jgi:hypothetical protein